MRRDEARAQALEEEEDLRTQAIDSERRLKLLRGEHIEDLPDLEPSAPRDDRRHADGHRAKKRKLAGEDDTDRDIRLARADTLAHTEQAQNVSKSKSIDGPIQDSNGHINLFPTTSQALTRHEPNPEAETERARKKREYEDQFTMRLSNAAGVKQSLNAPWYSSISNQEAAEGEAVGKDVWGNEDSGRHRRDQIRASANDPLAAMKRGVKQLREVEKERKAWADEKKRELESLKGVDRGHRRRHRRRHRDNDERDSLEGFSLDQPAVDLDKKRRHHRHKSRSHRSRSPERQRPLTGRDPDWGTHRSRR